MLDGENFSQMHDFPILAPLRKHPVQIALKQLTGIGEVLFGMGGGRRDPLEGLIENGDDAFLFIKRRKWELERHNISLTETRLCRSMCNIFKANLK